MLVLCFTKLGTDAGEKGGGCWTIDLFRATVLCTDCWKVWVFVKSTNWYGQQPICRAEIPTRLRECFSTINWVWVVRMEWCFFKSVHPNILGLAQQQILTPNRKPKTKPLLTEFLGQDSLHRRQHSQMLARSTSDKWWFVGKGAFYFPGSSFWGDEKITLVCGFMAFWELSSSHDIHQATTEPCKIYRTNIRFIQKLFQDLFDSPCRLLCSNDTNSQTTACRPSGGRKGLFKEKGIS